MTCDFHGDQHNQSAMAESSPKRPVFSGSAPRRMQRECERAVFRLLDVLGGTQQAAAKRLGISAVAVGRWVKRGYIPVSSLDRVAEVTGLPRSGWRPDLV